MTELLDTVADELSMCLRYHQGLFPERSIDRAIFLGGEARQAWMCQHIVKKLRLPAQLGDPIARMNREGTPPTPGLKLDQPQPGWAVTCGLCTAPTDL
jgi:Tfp pilus assembly PilM family ATPase